ncbi:MAG: DUF2189 domain-containing protein [Proteobacteria bacterium]|nr:DUF2189 domain-containing protein [Pseudomonadota bacterium]
MSHPYSERALRESLRFDVPHANPAHLSTWLTRGWRDFMRCPLPGLLYGVLLATFGWFLLWLARDHFWFLAGAFSGFLLVAPIAATGIYAVSRALERGRPANLATALAAWQPGKRRLVVFGLLLALAGTGWVLTSAAFITAFAPEPVRTPADFLRVVVLAKEGWLFELWVLFGALGVLPVYGSSVVAIPLLLDQRVGVLAAVLTSWRVIIAHPISMALWAGVLLGLTGLGMITGLLGLIVIAPWLAHASWHVYRDLVRAPAETQEAA